MREVNLIAVIIKAFATNSQRASHSRWLRESRRNAPMMMSAYSVGATRRVRASGSPDRLLELGAGPRRAFATPPLCAVEVRGT